MVRVPIMEGFSWTISGATVLMFLGWAGTLGIFLYKRGGAENEITSKVDIAHKKLDEIAAQWKSEKAAFDQHVRELDQDRNSWRTAIEHDIDQRFAGVCGQVNLLQSNLHETRENIARNYMTKPEISAIETRVTDGQGRIIDRIERFEGRLQEMQKSILEAIQKR